MSLKLQGIYKSWQPGDVASFDHAESRHLVASGLARVHEAEHEFELALVELQDTLPRAQLTAVETAEVARSSIAEPSTLAGRAIPAAMTPAAGGVPSAVLDGSAGNPALERAAATPDPLRDRDPHDGQVTLIPGGPRPTDPSVSGVELASRGASSGIGIAARDDSYGAAHALTDFPSEGVSDDDLAKVADAEAERNKPLDTGGVTKATSTDSL